MKDYRVKIGWTMSKFGNINIALKWIPPGRIWKTENRLEKNRNLDGTGNGLSMAIYDTIQ